MWICIIFLKVKKTVIPAIFGIPKTHKCIQNPPMRPIVSSQGSKTQPFAIYVDTKLKKYHTKYPHILVDSWDFLQKIGKDPYGDGIMFITVDVQDLFLVIPHLEDMDWFEQMVSEMNVLTADEFKLVLESMELVLKNNYIFFSGGFLPSKRQSCNGVGVCPYICRYYYVILGKTLLI